MMAGSSSATDVAKFLNAKRRVDAANEFWTVPARRIDLTSDSGLLVRLASQQLGILQFKPTIANAVMRALTILSILECAVRSRYYSFDRRDPPVEDSAIKAFSLRHGRYLLLPHFSAAKAFVTRYSSGQSTSEAERVRIEEDRLRELSLSFGELSNVIELTEHFVNSEDIHYFIMRCQDNERLIKAKGPRSSMLRLSRLTRDIVGGYRIRIGLMEYFELTLNIGMVAGIGSKRAPNEDLDRILRACFLPWYLDARSPQRAVNEWYLAVHSGSNRLQNYDLPEGSDRRAVDELELFNSTVSSFSYSSERLPSQSFHKTEEWNLALAVQ
jgi:hypothetical protein